MMHSPSRVACSLLAGATLLLASAPVASAQIRGTPMSNPDARWWFSAGANGAVLSDVHDGATGSTWKFGSDPLILLRGTIERGLDDATTIGLAVTYGKVDLNLVPFVVAEGGGAAPAQEVLPASCRQGCAAQSELWSAMAQFRSGGGPGFHTFFEANGGVTSFRNLRTRADRIAIGKPAGSLDVSGTLGGGFGYTLKPGVAVTLVQDFGLGYHNKSGLPEGVSRSWRIRTTRAALRYAF
jgi:hypothetical protein